MAVSISDPLIVATVQPQGGSFPAPPASPLNADVTATVPAPKPANTSTPVQHFAMRPMRVLLFALAVVALIYLVRKL
jgi:hypothetical protein